MKYLLILLLILFKINSIYAQDTIVKINNKLILADVIEVTKSLVKYIEKKDPKKRLRSIQKRTISHIIYSNRQIEHFPREPKHPPFPGHRKK